jgi:hypothetical protein
LSTCRVRAGLALDLHRLEECSADEDPYRGACRARSAARSSCACGGGWLLGSVRNQRRDGKVEAGALAQVDFLGEGEEDPETGRITAFGAV